MKWDGRKRRFVLVAVVLFLLLVVLPVGPLPWALSAWAERTVRDACTGCDLELEGARLWLFPPSFRVGSATLSAGVGTSTEVRVHAREITARLGLFGLLRRRFRVESTTIAEPEVVVLERPSPTKKEHGAPSEPAEERSSWRWDVGAVTVNDGKFRYEREALGKVAKIELDRIAAVTEPFHVGDDRVGPLVARADARLEESGKVHVNASVLSLADPLKIEVDVSVASQPLGKLNRYLYPDAAIRLSGMLVEGKAHVSVSDKHLQSSVEATYEGLKVEIDESAQRSAALAALMDFAAKVKTREKNSDEPRAAREERASCVRQPDESIVPFILRGMKEAAMAVASQ